MGDLLVRIDSRSAGLLRALAVLVTAASLGACGSGGNESSTPASQPSPPASPQLVVLAGNFGGPGSRDATGSDARFFSPYGVSVDALGHVYVTDGENHTVRRLEADGGVVTIAGSRTARGYVDGTGAAALFDRPSGIASAPDGNQYVIDSWNNRIRRVTSEGVVSTLAGGAIGSTDGPVAAASFAFCRLSPSPFPPFDMRLECAASGIAAGAAGTLYIADTFNNAIRVISPSGVVSTLAGAAGVPGSADGPAAQARFNYPSGVAVDRAGNVFVADTVNSTIRKISPAGDVTTVAGQPGTTGTSDGQGSAARFTMPVALAVDTSGNLYVADSGNHLIRKISPTGLVSTAAGTPGLSGSEDGSGACCTPARFSAPGSIALDAAGNLYVADRGNHTIRRVAANGAVTTVAGLAQRSGHADADGVQARFSLPRGAAMDSQGNLFVTDAGNHAIRRIDAGGRVSTFAGRPGVTGSADGGPGDNTFHFPTDVVIDGNGDLYVADADNHVIRKITAAGVASTVAGSAGVPGSSDGTGASARFWRPAGIAIDRAGNVYVADSSNSSIRKIAPGGIVTTLAGSSGVPGYLDAAGSNARFNFPTALAVDHNGVVYVVDTNNNRIRRIAADGVVTTFAGTGATGGDDGPAASATFGLCAIRIIADPQSPERIRICNGHGVTLGEGGDVYVADTYNQSIRKITQDGVVSTVFSFRSWFGYPPWTNNYLVETPADLVFAGNRLLVTAYQGVGAVLNVE